MSRGALIGTCLPCAGGQHDECLNTDPHRLLGCACCPERQVPLAVDPDPDLHECAGPGCTHPDHGEPGFVLPEEEDA